jgi:putative NADH-flavin reductase
MRIALLGASGRTGRRVLAEAAQRGHDVSVLVRDPARLPADLPTGVRVVVGDSTSPEALTELVKEADVVLSALGPTGKDHHLHESTAQALVSVMQEPGPRRFVGVSGAGVDVPGDQKALGDKVISALILRLGGQAVKDKPAEYAVWAGSNLDWTLVRPPRLNDDAGTGAIEHDAHRSTQSTKLTRADLAALVLDVAEHDLYVRSAPFVANRR